MEAGPLKEALSRKAPIEALYQRHRRRAIFIAGEAGSPSALQRRPRSGPRRAEAGPQGQEIDSRRIALTEAGRSRGQRRQGLGTP